MRCVDDTDVIVGAPFEDEGHGAAYVYHGCAAGLVDVYAQKLSPALLRLPAMRGFAYSFASRMDIDDNRYPGTQLYADPLYIYCLRDYGFGLLQMTMTASTPLVTSAIRELVL